MNRAEFAEWMLQRMLDHNVPDSVAISVWLELGHATFVGSAKDEQQMLSKLNVYTPGLTTEEYDTFKRLYKAGD